jgi:hypothetical protein
MSARMFAPLLIPAIPPPSHHALLLLVRVHFLVHRRPFSPLANFSPNQTYRPRRTGTSKRRTRPSHGCCAVGCAERSEDGAVQD